MHQRVCLFKLLGSGVANIFIQLRRNSKIIQVVLVVLYGTVNDNRLNLEDEQQGASNVLDVLKESTFQMENRINEEAVKKRAVNFYLSLHVNFHLSTDVTFLTNPQAVLSTHNIEVYDWSDVHKALDSIH